MMLVFYTMMVRFCQKKEISKQEIWQSCEEVCKILPFFTIARGFTLAHHVVEEVIKNKGSNKFLYSKDFHGCVQVKYENTDKGIRIRPSFKDEK